MRRALHGLVQEITHGLIGEMENHRHVENSTSATITDLLLQQMAKEVAAQLKDRSSAKDLSDEYVEAKLQKAEQKLQKLAITDQDDDEDETAGTGRSFPNLKYAKPKYENIESILKYVESDDEKGGVKLIIMNFND